MNKKVKNISKDLSFRIFYIKNEFKKIILKSVRRNRTLSPLYGVNVNVILAYLPKKASITKQYSVCLIRGRIGGVYSQFNIGRHTMTQLAIRGNLQNTKIKSW